MFLGPASHTFIIAVQQFIRPNQKRTGKKRPGHYYVFQSSQSVYVGLQGSSSSNVQEQQRDHYVIHDAEDKNQGQGTSKKIEGRQIVQTESRRCIQYQA